LYKKNLKNNQNASFSGSVSNYQYFFSDLIAQFCIWIFLTFILDTKKSQA